MNSPFFFPGRALALLSAVSLFLGIISGTDAAEYAAYRALDPSQPVFFDGKMVTWSGKTFTLDKNTLFLDYRLDGAQLANNPYAFNSLKEAAKALTHGTAEKPMLLLTAPGVYWVDDPDDPAIRRGGAGAPVGMTIACNYLYFYGLSTKRENVVFAVNRGQTQGAEGNFTMFSIQGRGLKSENITFGNYCNVDLNFSLVPSLSRPKRAEAIAQAQLFNYQGGDGVAINSAFISRLNLLPFARTYLNCHIESSGHAGGQSTYVNCTLEFYGVNFSGGRYFLNCDITFKPGAGALQGLGPHRFGFVDGIGAGGACVDTRFHRGQEMIDRNIALEVSWDRTPQSPLTRGYQHNVTLDGKPYVIQEAATPGATVPIAGGSDLLKAFKVVHDGKTYYNLPNLTGTDPFGYTPAIQAAGKAAGKDENYYLGIPVGAVLRSVNAPAGPAGRGGLGGGGRGGGAPLTIRSGQTTANLAVSVTPASAAASSALGKWTFTASPAEVVDITLGADGAIKVTGKNSSAAPVDVIVVAKNSLGLEACTRVTVEPGFTDPPRFSRAPVISAAANGHVTLGYDLGLGSGLTDESLITWYRCTDAQGANSLKVSVSRRGKPEITYLLSEGDVGSYLMATIRPKHSRSEPGPEQTIYARVAVAKDDVKVHSIDTNLQSFPTDPQPRILPGTWTVDGYFAPEAVTETKAPRYTPSPNSWTYGQGTAGSLGYYGLNETARGARLFYAPASNKPDDMTVRAKLAPAKNTGQGFGSATDQFLEVYIKYDLVTRTGYGLRIQRLTPEEINAIGYKGAGAVAGCAFFLVKYVNGDVTPISKKIMSSAFVTECTVELTTKNGHLLASVTSTDKVRSGDAFDFPREVQFDVPIESNPHGGTGLLFTGTVGVNAVLVLDWKTSWFGGGL
jgi:hypothetical protein